MKIHWFSYFLEKWGFFRRSLGILLAVSMLFNMLPQSRASASAHSDTNAGDEEECTYDVNNVCVVCSAQGNNSEEKDAAPETFDGKTGEQRDIFDIGDTISIKGSKKATAIERVELWYNGNMIKEGTVSPADGSVNYEITVDTDSIGLLQTDINRDASFTVRFVCSNQAEEEVEVYIHVAVEAVVEKGGDIRYLKSLQDAFEYLGDDGNITLLRDVNVDDEGASSIFYIWNDRTYTLDLNNHDITVANNYGLFGFGRNTSLTIKGEGKIEYTAKETETGRAGHIFSMQGNTGTLNIEGGEYISNNNIVSTYYKNNVNISKGTFTVTDGSYIFVNANNSGTWLCVKDMAAPGYCFADVNDEIVPVGDKTRLEVSAAGSSVHVRKIDFERDIVVELDSDKYGGKFTYGGFAYEPVKMVSLAGIKLTLNTDYTVTYTDNTDAGEATATVSGIGKYAGCNKTVKFQIVKAPLTKTGEGTASGVYGAKLSELAISGITVTDRYYQEISGSWKIDGDKVPDADDAERYTAVFTPDEGADNYDTLTAEVTLAVSRAEGILTVPVTQVSKTFGDGGFSVKSITNGDGAISYSSSDESVVSVSKDGYVTINGAGTAKITVSLNEGVNYTGAAAQTVDIEILKAAAPEITPETRKYIWSVGSGGAENFDISKMLPADRGATQYILSVTDNDNILSGVSSDSDGKLVYTVDRNNSVQTVGNTASVTVTARMNNYEDAVFTVNIEIADKIVTCLQSGSIVSIKDSNILTYGQQLSDLEFEPAVFVEQGTETEVKGVLSWKEPSYVPDVTGIQGSESGTAQWVFTPDDADTYTELTGTVEYVVAKATPVVEAPTADSLTYNSQITLGGLKLNGGSASSVVGGNNVTVAGTWNWKDTSVVPFVGNGGFTAVFTPDDTTRYNSVEYIVAVPVVQADNAPDMPSAAMSVPRSSKKVGDVELPAGWQWKDTDRESILGETPIEAEAVYTGMDSFNYKNVTVTVAINIVPKIITCLQNGSIVSVSGSNILTYGQQLSDLEFEPAVFVEQGTETEVKGVLSWKEPSYVPDVTGIQGSESGTAQWVFTPDDADTYTELTGTVEYVVVKATPVVEAPAVDALTYNSQTTLGSVRINGGSASSVVGGSTVTVAGTWNWKDTSVVPFVGNGGFTAVFTPDDTTRYNPVERTVAVPVVQADNAPDMPSAAMSVPRSSKKVGDVELPAGWQWKDTDRESILGETPIEAEAVYTGMDSFNYKNVTVTVAINIVPKIITCLQNGSIVSVSGSNILTYGQQLSDLEFEPAVFVEQGTETELPV